MDPNFWLERWRANEIGFHQTEFNPHLTEHWPSVPCAPGSEVFVPLCGKSRDLLWLAGQGHRVLGVEISPLAVQTFFEENRLQAERTQVPDFEHWRYGDITVLAGDFFDLQPTQLARVGCVYDRASLIALPPDLRADYVRHLMATLPGGAPILLVTLEYPQHEMQGPPFSVSEQEVQQRFGEYYNVQCLARHDVWAQTPRFQEKGLTALEEKVFLLQRA